MNEHSSTEPQFSPGLYVLATPIGNLGDLSPRARALLAAATLVAAEDTRTSRKLLDLADSHASMTSLTEHNVMQRAPSILAAAGTGAVALVSDAGTPGIADPGARLVEAAHAAGVPVIAVPGPSALAAAVSVSGFEGSDVHFLGFLPRKTGERLTRLREAAATASVLVCFENPGRLPGTLGDIATALDDPEVVVCRELTKRFEEVVRGRASALAVRFAATSGECTIVIRVPERTDGPDERAIGEYLGEMQRAGARRTAAAAEAARRFGVTRARAYELWGEDEGRPTNQA